MPSRLHELLTMHIKNNINKYILLIIAFATGVAAGAFAVNGLSSVQRHEMSAFLNGFLELIDGYTVNNGELLRMSVVDNIKLVIILWILGVSIIGIPLVFVTIGIKGFVTGFSAAFIIKTLGSKGVLFSLTAILSKEIIVVPALIAIGVNAMNFSLNIISSRSIKTTKRENLKTNIAAYSAATVFYSGILFAGILVEAYIAPILIRVISPVMRG